MAVIEPNYNIPLKALNYAEKVHVGFRKCGKVPTFYHQLSLLGQLLTLHPLLEKPWLVYTAALLHDVIEDHPDEFNNVLALFGEESTQHSYTLSKIRNGIKISSESYFDELAQCPVCSIVKAVDRIHNISTMQGPFSKEKQQKYITEVREHFLPMIKKASNLFVSQKLAYENAKSTLNVLCIAIESNL